MKYLLLLFPALLMAQPTQDPFAHTFSIVARDSVTGDLGVAVQSHWFSVGSVVAWAEAGVGAVATQSFVNVSYGTRGLELLKQGLSAPEAVQKLVESDEGRDFRQLAIVDAQGRVGVYTGAKCVDKAGDILGNGFSTQANMMLSDRVWGDMALAFQATKNLPFAERLMAAMKAAQASGGDIRGQQSAIILIVKGKKSDTPWADKVLDLRVEDHPEAITEMERLLSVHRAYELMNAGDLAIEKGDMDAAIQLYGGAMQAFPENLEMKYWTAVSYANAGKLADALPLFKTVFAADKNWLEMSHRIRKNKLLNVSDAVFAEIIE
jgi:uncharacterized Ntn-hydrolase superfamily protein